MHGLLPSQLQVTGQTQPSSILPGIEALDGRKNYFLFVKKVSLDLRESIHSLGMEMDCPAFTDPRSHPRDFTHVYGSSYTHNDKILLSKYQLR